MGVVLNTIIEVGPLNVRVGSVRDPLLGRVLRKDRLLSEHVSPNLRLVLCSRIGFRDGGNLHIAVGIGYLVLQVVVRVHYFLPSIHSVLAQILYMLNWQSILQILVRWLIHLLVIFLIRCVLLSFDERLAPRGSSFILNGNSLVHPLLVLDL